MEIASKKRKLLQRFPTRHDEARLFSLEQKHFMQSSWSYSVGEGERGWGGFFSFLPCTAEDGNELSEALCIFHIFIYVHLRIWLLILL